MATQKDTRFDIYKDITRKVVMKLSEGELPWRKRWCTPVTAKVNYKSRRPYSGINLLMLEEPGEYLTFNQCSELGGHVRKGEHSKTVYQYFPFVRKEDKAEFERREKLGLDTRDLVIPILKFLSVFHLSQTEGLETKFQSAGHEDAKSPVDIADFVLERWCDSTGLKITQKQCDTCLFDAGRNEITMPSRKQFATDEQWYNTAFRELVRTMTEAEGDDRKKDSAEKKELTAEIAACMIMSGVRLAIPATEQDTLTECSRWAKALENDYHLIVNASQNASKIAERVLEPII